MYEIVAKKSLSNEVKLFEVLAPAVAKKARPGQFVMVRTDEKGERIPLTIADFNRERGTITIIFQEIGKTTKQLGKLETGQKLATFAGPLGTASEIEKYGRVVCVGGGIGIAPLYPIVKALKAAENEVITIIGARNERLLILEKELRGISDDLRVATDDGSKGKRGFVTDVLKEVIERGGVKAVWAIGPVVMMKAVSSLTRPYGIKTIVSLNPIMIDGTGMCGGCRVTVGGKNKFACVDGPEFDGHQVDFDNLQLRNRRFISHEKHAEEHRGCELEKNQNSNA